VKTGKKTRLFGKRFKIAVGGSLLALAVLCAIFAPLIAPWDPDQQDLMARLKPGFWSDKAVAGHILGTDNYGRDLLSRLIYGSRLSILVGVSSMLLSALIGSIAGVIAGLKGGMTEQAIMRFADAQMAFPDILLAILMVAALGGNAVNLILVLGVSRWMVYARIVFGLTRTLRQRPFVEAATLYGGGDGYIMRRRVERAQGLMLTTNIPLAQIAVSCGIADQAHFNRLFRRFVGETPGTWRRARVAGPESLNHAEPPKRKLVATSCKPLT